MKKGGEKAGKENLVTRIRKRQVDFIGHVMRRGKLENLVTGGRLEGKRGRGRPRELILDSLALWQSITSISEMIGCTRDRRKWKYIIAKATRHRP